MPYGHFNELKENCEDDETHYTAMIRGHRMICGRCCKKNINSIHGTKEYKTNLMKTDKKYCLILKGEKACLACQEKAKQNKRITKTKADLQKENEDLKKKLEFYKNIIQASSQLIETLKKMNTN